MKRTIGMVAIVAALSAAAASAGDSDRGELLYGARCIGCHDESVHNRAARKALTIEGIKAQVRRGTHSWAAPGASARSTTSPRT